MYRPWARGRGEPEPFGGFFSRLGGEPRLIILELVDRDASPVGEAVRRIVVLG